MAESGNGGGGGLLDLEKELTCSICTDILHQPLTLLDCLHTFCGGCLKEWFTWQAASARNSGKSGSPYTCPSCREPVRGSKADWRLTTLLEGFLKANPDKGKTDEEKEEQKKHYKPGDNVLPPVRVQASGPDIEDERLMAEVREMSMADVDPETARRRAERSARRRHDRGQQSHTADRQQLTGRWASQQAARQQEEGERHVEHQPSLRSLLSGSEISSEDVQEEILQSIYSEGILEGIDIENLTPAQEEELTERIAEAYRRRQRNRDRSRNRERRERGSPSPPAVSRSNNRTTSAPASPPQQPQGRARPPISRPHLFEQTTGGAERNQRRSASSTSQRTRQSENRASSTDQVTPAARSATDLSVPSSSSQPQQQPRQRPRASSGTTRRSTDPPNMQGNSDRVRTASSLRPSATGSSPSSRPRSRDAQPSDPTSRQTGPGSNSVPPTSAPAPEANNNSLRADDIPQQEVRPAVSTSAFAPEPVPDSAQPPASLVLPSLSCSRCSKPDIAGNLHYNCSKCDSGNFNLCLECYREGRGCYHWFGFGAMAQYRWQRAQNENPGGYSRGYEYPHILSPRKYTNKSEVDPSGATTQEQPRNPPESELQEGAFCDNCFRYSNDCYWYCEICLEGSYGFCNQCVLTGKHCTHPLLPLAHISTLRNADHDPSKLAFLPVPHLKQHSYVLLPVLTDCDICRLPIPPRSTRFHCYICSKGDYDICNECYHSLVATGKISISNGPAGWRRCLSGHRMSVIGYTDTPYGGGQTRTTIREMVGGWRLKEEGAPAGGDAVIIPGRMAVVPPDGGVGYRCLAQWSRWPKGGDVDELAFPKNAEIREVEDRNADWAVGVFGGKVGLFPRNHTRRI